ncbi:MAG: methylated-DNA--[protein]-cysteine S-methyltransferase [Alteromonadaceae bacterium]|nr:methylated-DNA--[protein]-cysteine S-methyltransferase [Alteromonadaceae bacterium]
MARDVPNSITESCVAQLNDYFAGERKRFALPLAPSGTAYQHKVWAGLQDIEYGETWSYAQLAQHIGQPNGSRSVGNANSKNPIAIIIPCHRVIGANGHLTGYAGGLDIKSTLLAHENPQRGFF